MNSMKWNNLTSEAAVNELIQESYNQPVIVFKHSTRCPVSSMALNWFQNSWKPEEMKSVSPYFLDLISYREISNKIAEAFRVRHESPQLLLIKEGECIYHRSHSQISYKDLLNKL